MSDEEIEETGLSISEAPYQIPYEDLEEVYDGEFESY